MKIGKGVVVAVAVHDFKFSPIGVVTGKDRKEFSGEGWKVLVDIFNGKETIKDIIEVFREKRLIPLFRLSKADQELSIEEIIQKYSFEIIRQLVKTLVAD
jgi:hypothetical protein